MCAGPPWLVWTHVIRGDGDSGRVVVVAAVAIAASVIVAADTKQMGAVTKGGTACVVGVATGRGWDETVAADCLDRFIQVRLFFL